MEISTLEVPFFFHGNILNVETERDRLRRRIISIYALD